MNDRLQADSAPYSQPLAWAPRIDLARIRRVNLVSRGDRLPGSGWVAVLLREIEYSGWQFELHPQQIDSLSNDRAAVCLNILGADPVDIVPTANFLLHQERATGITIVSGDRLSSEHRLIFRECGAVQVIHSLASVKRAGRFVNRFFRHFPLSGEDPVWDLIPWPEAEQRNSS